MASMTKCDQCPKMIRDAEAEKEGFFGLTQAHEGPHDNASCEEHHYYFCSWTCLGIYATSKSMLDKLGDDA
jgi:hypothetical protein